MPETETPKLELWVPHLASVVGTPTAETFLVGHSMGCQTILRYIESLPAKVQVGGALLVAGFMLLAGLSPKQELVWNPWARVPIDLARVREDVRAVAAIFSDDDPFVPLDNVEVFRRELGATTVTLHAHKHFSEEDGVNELPEALDAVLKMAGIQP